MFLRDVCIPENVRVRDVRTIHWVVILFKIIPTFPCQPTIQSSKMSKSISFPMTRSPQSTRPHCPSFPHRSWVFGHHLVNEWGSFLLQQFNLPNRLLNQGIKQVVFLSKYWPIFLCSSIGGNGSRSVLRWLNEIVCRTPEQETSCSVSNTWSKNSKNLGSDCLLIGVSCIPDSQLRFVRTSVLRLFRS